MPPKSQTPKSAAGTNPPADLLSLGRAIHECSYQRSDLGLTRSPGLEESERLRAEMAVIEKRIESSAYDINQRLLRSVLGLKRDEVVNALVLRIVAYVAWSTLTSESLGATVARVASAVALGDFPVHLEARLAIRALIARGDVLRYKDADYGDGHLLPGPRLIVFLSGGNMAVVWNEQNIAEDREAWQKKWGGDVMKKVSPTAVPPQTVQPPVSIPMAPGKCESPKAIFEALRQTVIGMDPVVRRYSVQMAFHLKRVAMLKSNIRPRTPQVCVLLAGPSGCGKTMLAEACGKILGLPFAIGNMAEVSSEAYVGLSVSDLFLGFFKKGVSIADVQAGGILFCDEMDKKGIGANGGNDKSFAIAEGPQGELLRILESSGSSKLQLGGRRSNDAIRGFLDPFGLAVVCAGAFSGIEDVIRDRRRSKAGMGFSEGCENTKTPPDIREFLLGWLMPEFLNRIGSVIVIKPPDHAQLVQIATAPTGIIAIQNNFLSSFGLQIQPSPEAVREIAAFSLENRSFARGMRSLLTAMIEEAIFEERKGDVVIGVEEVQKAIAGLRAEPEGLS